MFHRNVLNLSISPSILHPVSICIFDDAWYFNLQCIIRGTKEIFSLLDVVLKGCTLNFYKVLKRMNPEFEKNEIIPATFSVTRISRHFYEAFVFFFT